MSKCKSFILQCIYALCYYKLPLDHRLCIFSCQRQKSGTVPDNLCMQYRHNKELLICSLELGCLLKELLWYNDWLWDLFQIQSVSVHNIWCFRRRQLFYLGMIRTFLYRCWISLDNWCKRFHHKMVFLLDTFCKSFTFCSGLELWLFPQLFWSSCNR